MGNEEDFPEVTAEALATYVLAAANYVDSAEASSDRVDRRRHAEAARTALDAICSMRDSRKIGILTEMQVNAAVLSLRRRLYLLHC